MTTAVMRCSMILVSSLFLWSVVAVAALAHPGRTNSLGCHSCRTNCTRWGLVTGQYHCRSSSLSRRPPSPAHPTLLPNTSPAPKCKQLSYETNRCAAVSRVIDGDTVELTTGERVRFIGIDTPERGDARFDAATERNATLIEGKTVTLDVCEENAKDRYGRTLAYVIVGATVVNEVLLREGHATALHIPPCGNDTATCYEALAGTVAGTGRRPLLNLSGLIQKGLEKCDQRRTREGL